MSIFSFFKKKPEVIQVPEPKMVHAEEYIKTDKDWLEVAELLKSITEIKESGTYIGGTLCVSFRDNFLLLNLKKNPPLVELWLSRIYVKYKTPSHSHWQYAKATVEHHPL